MELEKEFGDIFIKMVGYSKRVHIKMDLKLEDGSVLIGVEKLKIKLVMGIKRKIKMMIGSF